MSHGGTKMTTGDNVADLLLGLICVACAFGIMLYNRDRKR